MSPEDRFIQIQNTMAAFSPHYRQKMQAVLQEAKYEHPAWLLSFMALGVDPEPLTVEVFHSIAPYTNINTQREYLQQTAARGFLQSVGEDAYRLTDNGRFWINAFFSATGEALAALELPLPAADLTGLADLLERIIVGTETAVTPANKAFFHMSRRTDPGPNTPAMLRIDQYLTDLLRYRDDAHIAAWQPLGVSGHGWEAFTAIWKNGPLTAAELAERFTQRNHSAADYTSGLEPFVTQSWLEINSEPAFAITTSGRMVRAEVENRTNEYYFVGWQALTEDEQNKLHNLLQKLFEQLQRLTAVAVWPIANGALGAAGPLYADKTQPIMQAYGLNQPGLFFTLWQGLGIEPLPVSTANFARRFPYANPNLYAERLQALTAAGFVTKTGNTSDYAVTDAGREAYFAVDNAFTDTLSALELLPQAESEQLTTLLAAVVERSATQDDGTDKWCIGCSRSMHRNDADAGLVRVDEYLDDLNAYRDDAHLAAYAPYELSGPAMEAFTLLWKDGLNTAAALQERLEFRGNSVEIYSTALQELVAKGWATKTDNAFKLTINGQEVRQAIEDKTDAIFFAAWENLTPTQLNQLTALLTQLGENIQHQVETKTAVPA